MPAKTERATIDVVREAIETHLGDRPIPIDLDTRFELLGADSLDTVEITMTVEDLLDVVIEDEKMPDPSHTVGDFVKTIDEIRGVSN